MAPKGLGFTPGRVRRVHRQFWTDVILCDHPLREKLIFYVRSRRVGVLDFLTDDFRGASCERPDRVEPFLGAAYFLIGRERVETHTHV